MSMTGSRTQSAGPQDLDAAAGCTLSACPDISAGTSPAERVHPEVVEVMRELGIELGDRIPQLLTPELAQQADVVVTKDR